MSFLIFQINGGARESIQDEKILNIFDMVLHSSLNFLSVCCRRQHVRSKPGYIITTDWIASISEFFFGDQCDDQLWKFYIRHSAGHIYPDIKSVCYFLCYKSTDGLNYCAEIIKSKYRSMYPPSTKKLVSSKIRNVTVLAVKTGTTKRLH